jgi:hypothetical protein
MRRKLQVKSHFLEPHLVCLINSVKVHATIKVTLQVLFKETVLRRLLIMIKLLVFLSCVIG